MSARTKTKIAKNNATMNITEDTEQADTTHDQYKNTTIILEANATKYESKELPKIDLTNATDTLTGDRKSYDTDSTTRELGMA